MRAWGALLMLATLVTTYFTDEFRMTLVYGVPFIVALSVVYALWFRGRATASAAPAAFAAAEATGNGN